MGGQGQGGIKLKSEKRTKVENQGNKTMAGDLEFFPLVRLVLSEFRINPLWSLG
jgi:hypothetical protein